MRTIWRILSARGFVTPQPHKRPKGSYLRFAADQPNERWQPDITHWTLADGTDVEILNIIDDHSRLLRGQHTRAVFKAADVDRQLPQSRGDHRESGQHAHRQRRRVHRPLPRPRPGRPRGHPARPRHPLPPLPALPPADLRQGRTVPPDPQEMAAARQPPRRTTRQLQRQLDTFRGYYNTVRPHRALGRRTPAQAYTARPKAVPTGTPIDAGHYRVRHDKIDDTGMFTLRHNSRLHHIGLGRRHAGTDVLVLVHDLHIRVITDRRRTTPRLQPRPDPDYQPQAQT